MASTVHSSIYRAMRTCSFGLYYHQIRSYGSLKELESDSEFRQIMSGSWQDELSLLGTHRKLDCGVLVNAPRKPPLVLLRGRGFLPVRYLASEAAVLGDPLQW